MSAEVVRGREKPVPDPSHRRKKAPSSGAIMKGMTMQDWTGGYVADIDYTYGYYSELNPLRAKLAFLNQGLAFPEIRNACELGFGQGLTVNIHAAAGHASWHGTDFNPSQASFGRNLANVSGNGAQLFDQSFEQFCGRDDLPEFDFIGLHGIWSWIDDGNRAIITDFVRRKLNPGGVLYVSYNTMPGWSNFGPIRHLMSEHGRVMAAGGSDIIGRVDGAISFAEQLLASNPIYARATPTAIDRLKRVRGQNQTYVAHEYFNRNWLPMYFSDTADLLSTAKMTFACSSHFPDHIDGVNMSNEHSAMLQKIPHRTFRETTRDFIVNQQFRRDLWVKGARRLSPPQQLGALRAQRVILTVNAANVPLKVIGSIGEADMHPNVYNPILEQLADNRPHTIGQIETALKDSGLAFGQIVQAIILLMGNGSVMPVQDDQGIAKLKKQCERLNAHLCQLAMGTGEISFLASPVTGGGVPVNRFQQLFLTAMDQGRKQPEELAQYAFNVLSNLGQKIVKEGKTLETPDENMAELREQANGMVARALPIFMNLQVA